MDVDMQTRGHSFKLVLSSCNLETQKKKFHLRAVQRWNLLSEVTVMQTTLPAFKRECNWSLGMHCIQYHNSFFC